MTIPSSSDPARPEVPHADERASDPAILDASIAAGFEVRVQQQPIDIQSEIMPITRNPNVGAIVNFLGVVRHSGDFDDVVALELEHYPGMTEQSFSSIVEEAIARWRLEAVKIVHRVGRVALGDAVVLVVVAAPHRGAAFDACEFLMDFLKAHAPLWKKEIRRDGALRWVEAKAGDERSMLRWG
ncbi:molybdopterin synthase catalytic subunit [Paraburkholderia sp. BL23I1N1]|uniref:molybdenum cofactor biosynthesis protein MoaE n=1 Tax=Paraburkholderia sp. BL23I1N1 TaxID=1938802 RepID=UPI000E762427|nr:molybdenum cofactor biosynthesis protein MoaE [Paraburkholderia sp. BL23I1N1]RKE38494.1 molybdopterin synthase catalytic subunit [Paraburkholderia sp. BL23I1N1]